MRDISLGDMRRVVWGATFKLAALRSVASAVVLSILGLIFGLFDGFGRMAGFFLFWTIGSAIGGVANIYMLKGISALASPFAGGIVTTVCTLMNYLIALMLASGDPLVYALKKQVPDLVPVEEFGPLNLRAIIFVLEEDLASRHIVDEGGNETDHSAA